MVDRIIQGIVIVIALTFCLMFIFLPLIALFIEAFKNGIWYWYNSIIDYEVLQSIKLSIIVAIIAVIVNLIFGVIIAWVVTKFNFTGKKLLTTLIDLPFVTSPVIAGLIFVLFLGTHSWMGNILANYNIQIIYAVPGIILATLFVTLPLIAKELITLMSEQELEEEFAAISLGASGWQIFRNITLPNIKVGIFYGIVLCFSRSLGEFGAVSVVSGHIRGETNTIPLQIEILYNEYNFVAAFSLASLLAGVALLTIIVKKLFNIKNHI